MGHFKVSLSNTCGVDALTHLLATAYCDSEKLREAADESGSPLVQLAVHLVRNGTNAAAYQLRAEMLHDALKDEKKEITPGLVYIDCARTTDSLLQMLNVTPTAEDVATCRSPYCPNPKVSRSVPFLNVHMGTLVQEGIGALQKAVEENRTPTATKCLQPFSLNPPEVPLTQEVVTNYPIDITFSSNVLCAGIAEHTVN